MINEILVNDLVITDDMPRNTLKDGYKIKCISCNKFISRKWYDKSVFEKKYECKTCVLKYKNPMYNPKVKEKHNAIIQSDEYRQNMSELTKGENNGFYGKTHTKKTMNTIKEKLRAYWETMDDNTRDNWSKKASIREKNRMKKDPIGYRREKAKAARESHKSQFMNFKMNKIETIVYDYLKSLNIDFDYSAILASYQYDFIIRKKRILIEVDGDYWHGNPNMYNLDGSDGKKVLNKIQLSKQKKDKEKEEWAISRGFELIRIWEDEINNGKFKNKLKTL